MNTRKKTGSTFLRWGAALTLSAAIWGGVCSCSDNVDESNMYSFTGNTVTSFLEKTPEFSSFSYILQKVKLSDKSESTLSAMLSARGNYTCFAPTNEAIQIYLDSIYNTTNYDLQNIPDSTASRIAKNCIIDNDVEEAYFTRNFSGTSLEKKTMEDRYVTLSYETRNNKAAIILNAMSQIIMPDNEVENGVVHGVDRVLSPSTAFIPTLIDQTSDLRVFSKLLKETGWDNKLLEFRDIEYEKLQPITTTKQDVGGTISAPAKRNSGYTVFVESDTLLYQKGWISEMPVYENGEITNWPTLLNDITNKLRTKRNAEVSAHGEYEGIYADDPDAGLTDKDNIVNQFVSYHLLPEAMTYDKIVVHYVELGYAWNYPDSKSINCFEYYETMSQNENQYRRLLKFTDGATTGGIRINRYVQEYNLEDFSEISVGDEGILVKSPGKIKNDALNGFFYYLDDVLYYDWDVPNVVLNERLRWDVSSLFPEFITNGIRRPSQSASKYVYIPQNYLARMSWIPETQYFYGPQFQGWNYQSDEHNIVGSYDLTLKLPPVPYTGTYELRYCVSTNPNRGMCQVYLGKDKNNLAAIGLPLDMRLDPSDVSIGWEADDPDDSSITDAIDKRMRLHGYMKPPMHDGAGRSGERVTSPMRAQTSYQRIRKILWTGTVKASDVLYLRLKTVLDNTNSMLVLDFIEWCPKSVYNNSEKPEDKW